MTLVQLPPDMPVALDRLDATLEAFGEAPSPTFVYFSNDGAGCAVRNAMSLRRRIR